MKQLAEKIITEQTKETKEMNEMREKMVRGGKGE